MDESVKRLLVDALSKPGVTDGGPETYRVLSRAAAEIHSSGAEVAPDDVLDVVGAQLHRLGVSPADHRVMSALYAVHVVRVLEAFGIYDSMRSAD